MTRKRDERRRWYHCSQEWHGAEWTARRLRPAEAPPSEPDVPRLCVAETVARCFAAKLFVPGQPVYAYRTVNALRALKPRDVHDAVMTQERWLVPPVVLRLEAVICAAMVTAACAEAVVECEARLRAGHSTLGWAGKSRYFLRACEALGPGLRGKDDLKFAKFCEEMFRDRLG